MTTRQPNGFRTISFYRANTRNTFMRLELIMVTDRPGSPSAAPTGPSVWPPTQQAAAKRRPGEAISQAAASQRTQVGVSKPGDTHGSVSERPKAYIPQI